MGDNKLNNKGKLLMAVSGVLTSFVVLGLASFAWLTVSTTPESGGMKFLIGGGDLTLLSADGIHFKETIDISESFTAQTSLKPISTIDGINWYLCDYQEKGGNIVEDEFYLHPWCTSPEHGADTHLKCDNGGFFAYTDIWVKTDADKAEIRLSVPDSAEYYEKEAASGSYVLSYDIVNMETTGEDDTKTTEQTIKIMDKGPETCVRVGMLVYPEVAEDGEDSIIVLKSTDDPKDSLETLKPEFWIYEPNATVRSELDKQSDDYMTDVYVSGLKIKNMPDGFYAGSEGKYIPTYPIQGKDVEDTASETDLEIEPTPEPTPTPVPAGPAVFPAEHLIVQTGTTWNRDAIYAAAAPTAAPEDAQTEEGKESYKLSFANEAKKLLKLEFLEQTEENKGASGIVDALLFNKFMSLGRFVDLDDIKEFYKDKNTLDNSAYAATPLAEVTEPASQPIFTIQKGYVRQIRLYFWIEGQDLDCWNDVSGMNFLTRLEFSTTLID